VVRGEKKIESIPERRPPDTAERAQNRPEPAQQAENAPVLGNLPLPVWRCRVCGYLCARDEPPEVCPICKVKKDRFERFI
jgi:rubrerythrin